MNSLPLLEPILARAAYLVPILTLGLLTGELLARLLRFDALQASLAAWLRGLHEKLNRPQRSTATRLYRGMVVCAFALFPAGLLGLLLLMQRAAWVQLLAAILFIALIGQLVRPYRAWQLRQRAQRGTLALQSDQPHYLFADHFGQLRYHILTMAERFALLVGLALYYLIADLPGAFLYLALAACSALFHPSRPENRAFGWASCALFSLLDALPRFVACFLLWLAACFVPKARPLGTLRHVVSAAQTYASWLAHLLHLALGGTMPSPAGERVRGWFGPGNPKPTTIDFSRTLHLLAVAYLLLIMLLSATFIDLPIDIIN